MEPMLSNTPHLRIAKHLTIKEILSSDEEAMEPARCQGYGCSGSSASQPHGETLPYARRVELPRGLAQVGRADDVVAIEHLARLPADQLHRDPFGHAGTDEVADGGPAEVVEHAARHPGGATGRRPC